MPTPSTISIKLNGVDITNKVLYRETSFNAQANPMQGTFKVSVKDVDQDFVPVAGQKITLHIDGVPLFGGYVMKIGRGFFHPAEDTSTPGDVVRKWTLEGPDYNVLFDKRVVYDEANPYEAPVVPSGKRTISKAFTYLMNNYIDVPAGLDYSTHVDVVDTFYGDEDKGSMYVGQGKTWREQMEDFMDHGAVMYYIDADFKLHLHEYESATVSWLLTDKPTTGNMVGFREGTYHQDFGQIVTDAMVWGGSSIRESDGGPGGDIVFARYPDPPVADATWSGKLQSAAREQAAIDRQNLYGIWQRGEERAGQSNYLTQGSVKTRAFSIINGPPGSVPTYGVESGFSKPMQTMNCAWFAHDVPSGAHVRPGYLMDFILYTQGTNQSGTLVTTLPLRSMRVSFPTLPSSSPGDTYVRFDGDFGVAFSDRRYLWKAMKQRRYILKETTVVADASASSVPPGSQIPNDVPIETPDGVITTFTLHFRFYAGWLDVYINGLTQRLNYDYTYDEENQQITFATPPGVGDVITASGIGST
jgi:hypothetical protein